MHICDLTTLYIDGGAGGVNTYLTEKARYLTEHHGTYRHTIIVPGRENATQSLFGSTIHTLRSPRFAYNPHHRVMTTFRQIKQLIRDLQPDLIEVDCVYFLAHVAATAMHKKVPLVGFYHTHLPSFYARALTQRFGNTTSRLIESWAWTYVDYCMKPLDKILVASNDIYERLIKHTDKKIEQLPLGVNLHLFRPSRAPMTSCHRRRPVILYVGRLSQEKDLDILFEAFRLLNQQGSYQFQIVGDGPLRKKTEKFIRAMPDASYIGLIPYGKRLAELYASADVLAMPSRNETFGLAVLEALASGIPVVAIRQGGPTNLLHPRVGALAAPGDPQDFAEKLSHVLAEKAISRHCRTYVEQHFSWEKTFARLLDIYENMLETISPTRRLTPTED